MEAYLPMLQGLIERKGITTEVYNGERPGSCRFHADFIANWSWDGAMYLRYNKINIYDERVSIGTAEYEAGLMSLAKWGRTESKVTPLVNQLFQ